MLPHHAFQFVGVGLCQLPYTLFAWQMRIGYGQTLNHCMVTLDAGFYHQHHQRRHIALRNGGKRTKGEERIGPKETANNGLFRAKPSVGSHAEYLASG